MAGVSAVILAGGQSRRLGMNKAFVEINGQPLIQRVLDVVLPLANDCIVVTNEPASFAHLPVRVVGDVYPGKASLGGIYSGLLAARGSHAVVVGCDMPFLSGPLLAYMIAQAEGYDLLIPQYDGFLEPLHAVYGKHCLPRMEALILAGCLRISHLLREGRIRYITAADIERFDPARLSFFNINTPEDLARAHKLDRVLRADGITLVGIAR